jgi:hypothetical protein
MAKKKLTAEERLIQRLQRKLEDARTREELLGYLADNVLRHFFATDESIAEWITIAGGSKARKMMKALKVLFRYPGRGSVGKRLRDALGAQFFARKLEQRNRMLKKQPPPNTVGMLRGGERNGRGGCRNQSRGSSKRRPSMAD